MTSSHEALQEAHEQLQLYAKEVEELTAVKERNEIAREMKLSCLDGKVHIFISDDGAGVNEVHPGFGLIKLKKRKQNLQLGTLNSAFFFLCFRWPK